MSERFAQVDIRRLIPRLAVGLVIAAALLYIVVIANPSPEVGGNWRTTTFGSAFDDWRSFTRTLLNGLTFAGLLFIVASGFSLIFGLMRVVNMAHGSFYLLGGYVAYEVQQKMTGSGFSIAGTDVTTWEWVFPALVAASLIGVVGLIVQQVFLRWNQGQELRQALITIAISIIIADQVIAHFNEGHRRQRDLARLDRPARPVAAARDRLLGRASRAALPRTRCRARALALALSHAHGAWSSAPASTTAQMASALGVNIQFTFAIAFVVGSALAAFGGAVGTSQGTIAVGQDGQWLLNSLVVVIIGGLGSLLGAAVGLPALRARILVLRPSICPRPRQLLHAVFDRVDVRVVRPRARLPAAGSVREALVNRDRKAVTERAIGIGGLILAIAAPVVFNAYWVDVILTQALIVGIAAASLIFLAAYGGMVSLAQTMLMGASGFMIGNMVTKGGTGGRPRAPARLGSDSRARSRPRRHDAVGLLFGALAAPEHRHLLPDDHAHLFGRRLLLLRPGDGGLGLFGDRRASTSTPRRSSATSSA